MYVRPAAAAAGSSAFDQRTTMTSHTSSPHDTSPTAKAATTTFAPKKIREPTTAAPTALIPIELTAHCVKLIKAFSDTSYAQTVMKKLEKNLRKDSIRMQTAKD